MPITTDGLMLEPQNRGVSEYHTGLGAQLGATAAEAWADSPLSQLQSIHEIEQSNHPEIDFARMNDPIRGVPDGVDVAESVKPAVPRIEMIDALDRVKKAGLDRHLTLPNQPDIPAGQLEIMMRDARARAEREATIARGPQGFVPSALQVGTSFLAGAADPINIGLGFIPVMGELRYGKILASAGESAAGRLAVRAGVGAAQGVAGQAAIEPLDWYAHTQEGRDFGMADVLHNLMFGAALGGGLHAGGGFISDAYRGAKGRPLYPFGPGEPLEGVSGTHVPAALLSDEGVPTDALVDHLTEWMRQPRAAEAGLSPQAGEAAARAEAILGRRASPPSAEVSTINDLPPRAHEDAMRVAINDLINGDAVRSGDMLESAAQTDPRLAESFEAFHGSPHDFDRFDLSQIGTGEGAQAYGHGLYFAENEKVARGYQRATSDKSFVNKVAELYDEGFSPDEAWSQIKDNWKDFSPAEQRLMTALEKDDWLGFDYPHQAVSAALRDIKAFEVSPETSAAARALGHMYRVKISASHEHFLDWDKPLSEQSEHVRKALLEHPDASVAGTASKWAHDIAAMYSRLSQRLTEHVDENGESWGAQGPSVASRTLSDAGIPGIKYLDQGSRGVDTDPARLAQNLRNWQENLANRERELAEDPHNEEAKAAVREARTAVDRAGREVREGVKQTRNFVVFNDKHIEITHKNGEPVSREEVLQHHIRSKSPRGRAAADPQTWSLFEFLAHEGGLKPDPELQAIFGNAKGPFVPGFGALVRPKGRALDDALRLAKDHGYLFDPADVTGAEAHLIPRDLLDRLAEENAGRRQYKLDQQHASKADVQADLERERHEIATALHDELEAAGQKGSHVDAALEKRVVEIIQKEGEHDVLAAYERAIMEDAERYEGNSRERQANAETADIPGWDVPGDARATPQDGRAIAGEGGPAGISEPAARRADGGQSRTGGQGDRGPPPRPLATTLDRDAAWRNLAHVAAEFDQPDVVAASKAADRGELPKSKLDDRVAASEKAGAYAQSLYDMFAHRLPEAERAKLAELIDGLDRQKADRDTVTQRGAACLFEGRAG